MTLAAAVGIVLAEAVTLPLAWKWELGLRRVGIAVLLLGVLFGVVVSWLATSAGLAAPLQTVLVFAATVVAAAAVLAYRFYRDPERTPPRTSGAIVSPADGTVIYVHRVEAGIIPEGEKGGSPHRLEELTGTTLQDQQASVIGIAMSFLDVHVNRAPIAGRITLQRHIPGRFGSLKKRDMVFENERRTTVIREPQLEVAVVQIASRLVRRIVPFVEAGQEVELGARIGVIRLGSQVDVVIPATATVSVQAGDRVRAGESVIAIAAEPSSLT
jgi:phosphatidylserine decarboxylase